MYCEQCGKFNENGKKYCYSCGSPLIPVKKADKGTVGTGNKVASISSLAGARKNPSDYTENSAAEELKKWQKRQEEQKKAGTEAGKSKAQASSETVKKTVKKTADEKKKKTSVASEEIAAMEKELKQLNKSRSPVVALIAALLVFAVVLAVLINRIPKLYGAKQDALGFETAMLSGNWDTAYNYLYTEGVTSGYLTREMFEKVMSRKGASGFRNLSVEEVTGGDEKRVFAFSYETSEGANTEYVTMCPTGKQKMLFLKEWKVDMETVTVSDVSIVVPSEATLYLNGLPTETEGVANEEEHSMEYSFAQLFCGIWEAELQAVNRAPYSTDVEVTESDEKGVISLADAELSPDQELMDTVLNQFVQDYQAILEASVNREEFSAVEKYFATQAIQEGRAQNMYANACSQAYNPETGSGITKYELSDIVANYVSTVKSGYAQTGDLVMEVQSTLSYSYMDGGVEKSNTQNSVGLLCYHQENGQWKIQSFS